MADSAMGFYQAQGDLVIERFTNLIDSYSPDGDEFPYDTCLDDTFSIERVNLKKNQLNQLQTNLLPLLSRQVTLLAGLLDPYILQSKPGSTFKLILGIQSELDLTFKQIQSALYIVCPESDLISSTRTDDQHARELKSFRTRGLFQLITESSTLSGIMLLFGEATDFIKYYGFSTEEEEIESRDISSFLKDISDHVSSTRKRVKSSIDWIQASDFDLVQFHWPGKINSLEQRLKTIAKLIKRTSHSKAADGQSQTPRLSEPALQLATSLLPVLKLCRLFFNKVSKRGMNDQKRLPLFTEMRSDQLRSLSKLAEQVRSATHEFVEFVRKADTTGDLLTMVTNLTLTAEKFESCFESSVLLIAFYIVPLIPDTNGFPTQKYYQSWLTTWHLQLSLAMQNLRAAAKLFGNIA